MTQTNPHVIESHFTPHPTHVDFVCAANKGAHTAREACPLDQERSRRATPAHQRAEGGGPVGAAMNITGEANVHGKGGGHGG